MDGLASGADNYLIKPFSARELMARVGAHFNLARLRKDAELSLRHSEEILQKARNLETVGKLAGGIAHEFNNLLTAALGYAELALDDEGISGSVRDYLGEVSAAAQRAAELTAQLLAYGQRQSLRPLRKAIDPTIVDLAQKVARERGPDSGKFGQHGRG